MSEVALYLGDCLEYMRTMEAGSVDAVVTDPPYPNFWQDEYGYKPGMINFLDSFMCRQFVFWTITEQFPLSYTAKHTWDKVTGTYARYEYIYERNGQENNHDFRYAKIQNEIDAQMNRDVKTIHPSQKPLRLIKKMISEFQLSGTIFDPFMGSGTTGVAAVQLGRNFIGCEIDPGYFAIAERRIKQAKMQIRMEI